MFVNILTVISTDYPINNNMIFINMNIKKIIREEINKGLITEKCWKGYTQKGMKTMFGKKYPNCVKKRK